MVETTTGRVLLYEVVRTRSLRVCQQGDEEEGSRRADRHHVPELRPEGNGHPGGPAEEHGVPVRDDLRISICIDDMVIPSSKKAILDRASASLEKVINEHVEGLITPASGTTGRRHLVAATEKVAKEMIKEMGPSPSGEGRQGEEGHQLQPDLHDGRLRRPRIRQADDAAGRDARPDAKPSGEIIETPIRSNFREDCPWANTSSRPTARGRGWRTPR